MSAERAESSNNDKRWNVTVKVNPNKGIERLKTKKEKISPSNLRVRANPRREARLKEGRRSLGLKAWHRGARASCGGDTARQWRHGQGAAARQSGGAALRRRGDAARVKQRCAGRGGGSARRRRRCEHGAAEEDCERRWRTVRRCSCGLG
jgi:hypothetical protein